ncbi:endoplasmic reticulum-based factor for assembly of V-ATPase-domain-containing protein [Aspergillus ambiguus]|uniref:TMEM199/VMA12 family protein n=1 Tax=Aspergillus ambiguus TaxID=176160 RepID=UPI003CCC9807
MLLVTTPPILAAFLAIPPDRRPLLDLPDSLALDAPISHLQLIRLARYVRSESTSASLPPQDRSLNALLRGTKLYIPPPPPKPAPSPEYLALKARLLAATEADAYQRMTTPTSLAAPPGPSPVFATSASMLTAIHDPSAPSPDESAPETLTPSLVLNIFLSVLITGFSVYWALTSFPTPDQLTSTVASLWGGGRNPAPRHISPSSRAGTSEAVRVLLSLFAALGVGVVEVLIYAIYWRKAEDARRREKKMQERKVVVESEVLGGRPDAVQEDRPGAEVTPVGEKEEIWGRGPNGGLRRRVRERWEEDQGTKQQQQQG